MKVSLCVCSFMIGVMMALLMVFPLIHPRYYVAAVTCVMLGWLVAIAVLLPQENHEKR